MLRRSRVGPVSTSMVVHKGYQINTTVLDAIVSRNCRVLWAFVEKDGEIRAVPYTEDQVIWIEPRDLEREDEDV